MVTISYTKPKALTSTDYSPPINSPAAALSAALSGRRIRGRHLPKHRGRDPASAALRAGVGARYRGGGRSGARLSRPGARQAPFVAGRNRSAGLAVHDPPQSVRQSGAPLGARGRGGRAQRNRAAADARAASRKTPRTARSRTRDPEAPGGTTLGHSIGWP